MAMIANPAGNSSFNLTDPDTTFGPSTSLLLTTSNSAAVIGDASKSWNVTNKGNIVNNGSLSDGISIQAGSVYNIGNIQGALNGVYIPGDTATVVNEGSIEGGSVGIKLGPSGMVLNKAGAIVKGSHSQAVTLRTLSTLNNAGTIEGIFAAGPRIQITNSGMIAGNISTTAGVSIVNTGTVSGDIKIQMSPSYDNVLDNAGSLINGTMILSGAGSAKITLHAGSEQQGLRGFMPSDRLYLMGISPSTKAVFDLGKLTVGPFSIPLIGAYAGSTWMVADDGIGNAIVTYKPAKRP